MEKITDLTEEQKAILPKFRDEWLNWGICTGRADRPKAEAAIMKMRHRIKVKENPIFIWVQSPMTGCLAVNFLKSNEFSQWIDIERDSLQASLGASLRDSLGASLQASLRDSLGASLRDSLWASLQASLQASLGASLQASLRDSLGASLGDSLGENWRGQHDSYWIAFYLFCRDVLGVRYEPDRSAILDLWRDIAQSCCWWWCYRNYVIVCERPTICRLDDRGVIHGEDGPAIAFVDGWAVHAWHGVRVPSKWIEQRDSLTAATALAEPNIECRRAACEILGWERILSELNARTIDIDTDPMIGELVEVDLPDAGCERFLRVLCGTGRRFAIPVPPNVQTALEANAWTWGLDAASYKPEVRT